MGQQLLDNGKPAEAEAAFRDALKLWRKVYDSKHPHRPILFRYLIESLAQQDKCQDAEAEIQREADISPGNDYCATLRVALKLRSGEWDVTNPNWLATLETKINPNGVSFTQPSCWPAPDDLRNINIARRSC